MANNFWRKTKGEPISVHCSLNFTFRQEVRMLLRWAPRLFIVALLAALFRFGGIAVAAAGIAKIIFFLFLTLFVLCWGTCLFEFSGPLRMTTFKK